MIVFAPCKINIGLKILSRRDDGYHNIDSYLYPVPLYDILEIIESDADSLIQTGFISTTTMEDNLIYKSLTLLRKKFSIPPLNIHLHKQIPFQAGLGGGSSDAVSLLKLLNSTYCLNISDDDMLSYASELGSDCPFFIQAKAARIAGRGEQVFHPKFSLKGKYIMIVKPSISISTSDAFQQILFTERALYPDIEMLKLEDWGKTYLNDFQLMAEKNHPEISKIIGILNRNNSMFSSLTGSGSAVFGIFDFPPKIDFPPSYFNWVGQLQ